MVAINSLRLAVAAFGLTAVTSSVVAQTVVPVATSSDPQVAAAIYHAAGNSTQVSTDIVVTQPTANTIWYAQNEVSISWTGTQPLDFAFQIINKDTSVRASGITLLADAKTTAGTATSRIGKIEPGTYFVRLYDPTDISKQIALSSDFIIKSKSEMLGTAQGGTVNGNSTSTSTTANGIAQPGYPGQASDSFSAANPSSTKTTTSAVTNAAASSQTQNGVLTAAIFILSIAGFALQ